jgi:hypothetical protein
VLNGTTTSVFLNLLWKRYYLASTMAAGVSAILTGVFLALLDWNHSTLYTVIVTAIITYFFLHSTDICGRGSNQNDKEISIDDGVRIHAWT